MAIYDNLVSYWRCNSGTGSSTLIDAYQSNDGTLNGSVDFTTSGKFGNALTFPGVTNNNVTIPYDSSLALGDAFTFSLVIYSGSTINDQMLISNVKISLKRRPSNVIEWFVPLKHTNGSTYFVMTRSTNSFQNNEWVHIVGVCDLSGSGKSTVYLNNVATEVDISSYVTTHVGTDQYTVGTNNGGGIYYTGKMDDIVIWDRALTSSEVDDLYTAFQADESFATLTPGPTITTTSLPTAYTGIPYSEDVEIEHYLHDAEISCCWLHDSSLPDSFSVAKTDNTTLAISGDTSIIRTYMFDVVVSDGFVTNSKQFILESEFATATDLISYWKLDETVGPTSVDVYGGHNGTDGGDTVFGQTGKFDKAVKFYSGSNKYLTIADADKFDLDGSFTISCSIYTVASGGTTFQRIITKNGVIILSWDRTNGTVSLSIYSSGSSQKATSANGSVAPGTWKHIVATYNSSTNVIAIYVNNVKATTNFTLTRAASTDPIIFGYVVLSPDQSFVGYLDDVAIWDRAISDSEVDDIWTAWSAGDSFGTLFPGPTIETELLPTAYVNSVYSQTITATSLLSDSEIILEISQGTLPSQYTFVDNGDGTATISGKGLVKSSNTISITATDSNGSDTMTYTFIVEPHIGTRGQPYKFRLGAVDAFRMRELVSYKTFSTLNTPINEGKRAHGFFGARKFVSGEDIQFSGEFSKAFFITDNYGPSERSYFDVYYRGEEESSDNYKWIKRVNLWEEKTYKILLADLPYNSYRLKLVPGDIYGDIYMYGLEIYKYFDTVDMEIQDTDLAFEFEINPTEFSQVINGGFLTKNIHGISKNHPAEFGGGTISLTFSFIRGITEQESYNYYNNSETNTSLSYLSHSDKYKLQYFAKTQQQLILVTDEYVDFIQGTHGRLSFNCRIEPGSLSFSRLPIRQGEVDFVNTLYQESYSANVTLRLLNPAVL